VQKVILKNGDGNEKTKKCFESLLDNSNQKKGKQKSCQVYSPKMSC